VPLARRQRKQGEDDQYMAKGSVALNWIEHNSQALTDLSDQIWHLAEVGLQETRSAQAQEEFLAAEGFKVTSGVAGMPSAFVAEWGNGKPVIGFLGEYDALPGISQKPQPTKEPLREGAPGHGCGHNLLGVGALGAAAALKRELESAGIAGTVKYFGCPAEETLVGKVFMARAGLFDDVDAAITWHPGSVNAATNESSNAMNSVKFRFYGRTAHAAGDPHHGRSALDGVELMNVGANYLREHVIEKARLHYVITDGGGEPNVVPAHAEVWYYVRAPERSQVDEIYAWLLEIAEGAAKMTRTTFDVRLLAACYNYLPSLTVNRLLHKYMEEIGPVTWSAEELEFARKMNESFAPGQKEAGLKAAKAPKELYTQLINDTIIPWREGDPPMAGSTDVGDVSWVTPTGQLTTATGVLGQPGHSWQVTACSGMSIGHKGMVFAAKVMAMAGLTLMTDAEQLAAARAEWTAATKDSPYQCPVPADIAPPLDQLKQH
jgi:aminobenzoyl-glutamate utilization protein B